jgi:hypothetical protein
VVAARAPLAGEIAALVASHRGSADEVLLASTGILGCALANIEQVLAGAVDGESAWRVTSELALAYLR